jgi:hypothetical protein
MVGDAAANSDTDAEELRGEADPFAASGPPSMRSRGVSAGSAAGAAALAAPMPMVPDPSLFFSPRLLS